MAERDGGRPQRAGSSTDLAAAMQAAALIADGPDLDAVTDELIEIRKASIPTVDVETIDTVRPIGMGGQGGVWLAIDPGSGMHMAVKQVRKGRLTMLPKKAMTRALTERECLLEVGFHPFITTCYACFQNDSSLFFALELAPAGDLFGLLDMHPTGLPEHQAKFYCTNIGLALRHVHAHGWVYRDVKCAPVPASPRVPHPSSAPRPVARSSLARRPSHAFVSPPLPSLSPPRPRSRTGWRTC